MKKSLLLSLALSANLSWAAAPTADVAIVLDTSGSMQGLINQVRDGLWKTLNSLGSLQKNGEKAQVRLALLEYGSGTVSAEADFIQVLSSLTTDHTLVAESLFATKTQGSMEYSGLAIERATQNLAWSSEGGDFRTIVIAGNETIRQGSKDALEAAREASQSEVIVNSIFAGAQSTSVFNGGGFGTCSGFFCPRPVTPPVQEPAPRPDTQVNPIFLEWRELAHAGGGQVLNIDQNQTQPYIESPFDKEIIEKTTSLNDTFLPFGESGLSEYERILDLDGNIRNSGAGSYMDWGSYRGGSFGVSTQSSWDLVSLAIEDEVKFLKTLKETKESLLPKEMQSLSLKEKIEFVMARVMKRQSIEEEIKELKEKRNVFVENELDQLQEEGEKTFEQAFKEIIVKQLEDQGFSL